MNNTVSTNYVYHYIKRNVKPEYDTFSLPYSIGKLPQIKMKLPEISLVLANIELTV